MKKKFLKTVTGVVLTLSIAAAGLTGCGNSGTKDNAASSEAGKNEASSEAASEEKKAENSEEAEEIKVMIWDRGDAAPGTTAEENALTDWIAEQVLAECNVKVTYVPIPRSESDDKINAMLAGGSAPDLIYTYNRSMVCDYAEKGGLTDLTDALNEYGPELKEVLAPTLEIGMINGGQYSLPQYKGQSGARHMAYIRKDWLDALNLEVPTTKEELIDVLYQFKEKDVDQLGDKLHVWAMGGNPGTEKYFANFVSAYADGWDEESQVVYQGYIKAVRPGTQEGYRIMNQLYNDGIITKEFAVDTNDDVYKQDIANGYTGFFIEDATRALEGGWLSALQQNNPKAEFIAVNIFNNKEGNYKVPGGDLQGRYLMVPKASEDKADAVVKFLNWMSDPQIGLQISFSPDVVVSETGVPSAFTEEELYSKGYPKTLTDYSIVGGPATYRPADKHIAQFQEFTPEYIEYLHEVIDNPDNLYYEPVVKKVLQSEAKYGTNMDKLIVEFAYKVISADTAEFDDVYKKEYDKLLESGLKDILEERTAYFAELN